jgi:hypothetical protein
MYLELASRTLLVRGRYIGAVERLRCFPLLSTNSSKHFTLVQEAPDLGSWAELAT